MSHGAAELTRIHPASFVRSFRSTQAEVPLCKFLLDGESSDHSTTSAAGVRRLLLKASMLTLLQPPGAPWFIGYSDLSG